MTATEVARTFSDVLNRVSSGEEIEITRSGAPVARLAPARDELIPAARFRELIASAPPVDPDFAADVRASRDEVAPPADPWRS
jgi:prevent-host-death family protein